MVILHQYTGDVLCALNADSLSGADLAAFDLRFAGLSGVDLRCANLCGANLSGSDLGGADLVGANLRGANLRHANLRFADLTKADLADADLTGADLTKADLVGANLTGADLADANLYGVDLRDAINAPLVVTGLRWLVLIDKTGWMRIGCEYHPASAWAAFSDEQISALHMDASSFWRKHGLMLLALAQSYQSQD